MKKKPTKDRQSARAEEPESRLRMDPKVLEDLEVRDDKAKSVVGGDPTVSRNPYPRWTPDP